MAFPDGFLWGTAASSTQCEGAAPRSDWHRWEQLGKAPASGAGNGFATEYARDFAMLAEHGLTHHRLSLEWARLEPEPGRHEPSAVEHYRAVLQAARDAGVSPWVCLHHFTLPGWFGDDEGGFLDDRARGYFWPRHVDWVAETFGDLVAGWMPINEPVAYAFGAWLMGVFPPGRTSFEDFATGLRNLHLANHDAWRLLGGHGAPVATVMNLMPLHPAVRSRDVRERDAAEAAFELVEDVVWRSWTGALRDGVLRVPGTTPLEVPEMAGSFDLVGFSYYNAASVYAGMELGPYPADATVTAMGYAPWPEGLGVVLHRLADELPGRALLVAECGLGTSDPTTEDSGRVRYLDECLGQVQGALDDGIDVRGLFHWTAVDNYEWLHGYDVQFGLFDRDRRPRQSAALARRYALGP